MPGEALYNLLQEKSIVFPDIALNTERLSPGEKFQLFVDNSVSVDTITWSMLGSAVGQADNSPTGFRQGWDAYAKRFGSAMGRQASSEFFGTFVIASALHEDPRFYPEINPGFFHAIKYSLQRVFVMRNDDGHEVVTGRSWRGRRWRRDWRTCTGQTRTAPSVTRSCVMGWIWQPNRWQHAARVLAGVLQEDAPRAPRLRGATDRLRPCRNWSRLGKKAAFPYSVSASKVEEQRSWQRLRIQSVRYDLGSMETKRGDRD